MGAPPGLSGEIKQVNHAPGNGPRRPEEVVGRGRPGIRDPDAPDTHLQVDAPDPALEQAQAIIQPVRAALWNILAGMRTKVSTKISRTRQERPPQLPQFQAARRRGPRRPGC
jgi:hypothetical protein